MAEDEHHDQGGQGHQGRSGWPGRVGAEARGERHEHVGLVAVWECRLCWAHTATDTGLTSPGRGHQGSEDGGVGHQDAEHQGWRPLEAGGRG